MRDTLVGLITLTVGAIVAGQLLVAATAKISGFVTYQQRVGSRALAACVIASDLAISLLVAVVPASTRTVFLTSAGFLVVGALYRAHVVRSPTLSVCICANAPSATTWADVAANIVTAFLALGVAAIDPVRSGWLLTLNAIAIVTFAACWWRVEGERRQAHATAKLEPADTPAATFLATPIP